MDAKGLEKQVNKSDPSLWREYEAKLELGEALAEERPDLFNNNTLSIWITRRKGS